MAEGKEELCLLDAGVREGERARRSRLELSRRSVCSDGRDGPEILLAGEARATKQRGSSRAKTLRELGLGGEEIETHNPGGHGRKGELYRELSLEKSRCPVEGVLRKKAP